MLQPDFRTAAEAPPQNRITQATFQAARQASHLTPEQRRANRDELRAIGWPPGLVANRWLVARPFAYSHGGKTSTETYVVGAPYEFDGASVPFLLTAFIPRSHSDLLAAAALHDWLYEREHETVPRPKADAIFREALQVLGLHWFWALLMWRAVRVGGWLPWYARKDGWLGMFVRLPKPLVLLPAGLAMAVWFVTGFAGDLLRLGAFRDEGQRIRAEDH